MRYSTIYFIVLLVNLAVLCGIITHSYMVQELYTESLAFNQKLVGELGLTDLCLFTEARYTRHLTQADIHAPFQDGPALMEHFPSGSLVTPPFLLE